MTKEEEFEELFNALSISRIYKNGGGILLLTIPILYYKEYYLANIFFLKLFSANYFIRFSYLYPYPELYKWKHLIRLTDTGHIAALLVYFDKRWIPITFNITFVITFSYWTAILLLGMEDEDRTQNKEIIGWMQELHASLNHGSYFLWMIYFIHKKEIEYNFDDNSMLHTTYWVLGWLFFIYIPWFYKTNDYVYSIMRTKGQATISIIMVLIILYFSNKAGNLLVSMI